MTSPHRSLEETIRGLETGRIIEGDRLQSDALFWLRALHAHRMALELGSSPPAPVVLPLPRGLYVDAAHIEQEEYRDCFGEDSPKRLLGRMTVTVRLAGEPTPEVMAWLEQAGVKLR